MNKPSHRPRVPHFSSGPCAKRPGWTPAVLAEACLGRSHRAPAGAAKLQEVLERTRSLLALPADYQLALVPGSDTGAVEMALWSMLGARGVDVLAWESFGAEWVYDVVSELKIQDVRVHKAAYGELPALTKVDCNRDVVFTWNGTTSGVRVPNGDWIPATRQGLTICDATSAVFAMELPWPKLDVTTFSWQKVLGGEAAHGMLILSPRAVERARTHRPVWPVPKLLRLAKGGRIPEDLFTGGTINTPSMLCVEDVLDSLRWAQSIGGLDGLHSRCQRNFAVLDRWVTSVAWLDYLAADVAFRSETSVCLQLTAPWFRQADGDTQSRFVKRLCALLESEGVAYDISAYRAAPPGLRIWCGATVETSDLEALCPWLDWGYQVLCAESAGQTTA